MWLYRELLTQNPKMEYLPEFDPKSNTVWHGIKALWFEGVSYQGKKTKVFAYIGYPEKVKDQKVPAIVLVHGGEGHAFPEWIKKWNEKGFAAIAMDTTGYFPNEEWRGLVGTEEGRAEEKYERRLYGQLEEEGYIVGPDNTDMKDIGLPLQEQWMYHAIADTILAHNILLEDEHIDSEKIGICGISWGAVITSLAIGYDTRYAFGIPIYGSGYLGATLDSAIDRIFRQENIKKLWSAEDRLQNINFPVLWLCWRDDWAFSIIGNSMSYERTKRSGSILSINSHMGHGHVSAWVMPEPYRFATNIVNGEVPLIRVIGEPDVEGELMFEVDIPGDFVDVEATLYYLNESKETWMHLVAGITENRVYVQIPEDAHCYYVELQGWVEGMKYLSSTKVVTLSRHS